jgi:hypothetical protein
MGNQWVKIIEGIIAIITLVVFWRKTNKATKIMSLIFLLIGIVIFVINKSPIILMFIAFTKTINYLVFTILVQVISFPVILGEYMNVVKSLADRNEFRKIIINSSFFVYILSCFLLIGAIPICYYILEPALHREEKEVSVDLLNRVIMRSFSLSLFWTPISLNVAIALQITGAGARSLLLITLPISIILFLICQILEVKFTKYNDSLDSIKKNGFEADYSKKQINKKMGELIFIICLMSIMVIKLNNLEIFKRATIIYTIIFICFIITILWSIYLKCINKVKELVENYFLNEIQNKFVNQSIIFIVLGFFVEALNKINFLPHVFNSLYNIWDYSSSLNLIMIPLFIILMSLIGIHPFAGMVLIGTEFIKYAQKINVMWLTASLALGGSLALITSPFVGPVLLFSGLSKKNPYHVGIKKNLQFTVKVILLFYMMYLLSTGFYKL